VIGARYSYRFVEWVRIVYPGSCTTPGLEGAVVYAGPVVRLSEGRGQNNQQPTPNDNNKRVVVFLCGSGR